MVVAQEGRVPLSLIVGCFNSRCFSISSDTGHFPVSPMLLESTDGKYIIAWHDNCQLCALSLALNWTVKIEKTKSLLLPRRGAWLQLNLFETDFQRVKVTCLHPFALFAPSLNCHSTSFPRLLLVLPLSLYRYSWTVCAYRQPFHLFIPFSFNHRMWRTDLNSSWQYSQIYFLLDSIRHTSLFLSQKYTDFEGKINT